MYTTLTFQHGYSVAGVISSHMTEDSSQIIDPKCYITSKKSVIIHGTVTYDKYSKVSISQRL